MATKKMGKRQLSQLEKIAALLNKDVSEIVEKAQPLYTEEATVLEIQSAINFYHARIKPEQGLKETKTDFEKRYEEWRFRTCRECNLEFAYSYHYEGVGFCSLECADVNLMKITGLQLTRGRDVRLRWGLKHPAIVSATALATFRDAYPDSLGTSDVPFDSVRPKYHKAEL